jgi:hypothetical protein
MRITDCECTVAGWCARHHCHKTNYQRKVCRRSQPMFQAWEQRRGPSQRKPRHAPCKHRTGVFDKYGNLEWVMDERGFIIHMEYDTVTGAVTRPIQDVDTSQVTDEPSGWETPTGGSLHTVTDFEHDDLGRVTQSLGPARTVDIDGTATSVRRATMMVAMDC